MLRINKHIILFALLGSQLNSCINYKENCGDVKPGQKFRGTGYVFYKQNSQDAHREILFFPVCNKEFNLVDSSLFSSIFKSGISFTLPLTGQFFRNLSFEAKNLIDDRNYGNEKKIFYNAVEIEFDSPVNSRYIDNNPKKIEYWHYDILSNGRDIKLTYFVSNESNLVNVKVLK